MPHLARDVVKGLASAAIIKNFHFNINGTWTPTWGRQVCAKSQKIITIHPRGFIWMG